MPKWHRTYLGDSSQVRYSTIRVNLLYYLEATIRVERCTAEDPTGNTVSNVSPVGFPHLNRKSDREPLPFNGGWRRRSVSMVTTVTYRRANCDERGWKKYSSHDVRLHCELRTSNAIYMSAVCLHINVNIEKFYHRFRRSFDLFIPPEISFLFPVEFFSSLWPRLPGRILIQRKSRDAFDLALAVNFNATAHAHGSFRVRITYNRSKQCNSLTFLCTR